MVHTGRIKETPAKVKKNNEAALSHVTSASPGWS